MKKKSILKSILIWTFAVIITLAASVYQRLTGPTYPKRGSVTVNNNEYKIKLLRSHGGKENATIELDIDDETISATIFYKNYPIEEKQEWQQVDFVSEQNDDKNVFFAELPHQPPAGKLIYFIELYSQDQKISLFKEAPIVIRFKGGVPAWVLIPHIIFMFFGMLFANATGLFALFNFSRFKLYTTITLILIFIGGMILGPIVQKFAFLEYWAGVPFGWDLTDNKLLIAFIAWIIAFFANLKKERKYFSIIAALITIIIFSIPHSMFGSELNRLTGEVTQGFILLLN